MKTMNKKQALAATLAALMGVSVALTALSLTGCPGPVGPEGQQGEEPGQPGEPGKAAPVMTPLWLGTFPVILEDQGGRLDAKTVDWIQDALAQFASSGSGSDMTAMTNLTGSRGNHSLRIVVEYVPAYETNVYHRVIDGRTLALSYEIGTLSQTDVYYPICDGLRATSNTPLALLQSYGVRNRICLVPLGVIVRQI